MAVARRGVCAKAARQIRLEDFGGLDRHDRLETVVRGAQQHAAQAEEVTGHLEIDDLAGSIGLDLVGANPSAREDVGGLIRLPLVHHVPSRAEGPSALVKPLEHGEFSLRQGDKGREFAGQGAVLC
jgi:hypothetical protein